MIPLVAIVHEDLMYDTCVTALTILCVCHRPRKTVLPPTDDSVMLVTPPTVPHPSRGPTGRQERKAKAVKSGVGNRRSARLLTGKK